ncbi:MAG: hypothetical protein K2X47_10170 [Bdellovibrionales bacterium]|nr:hypothetical protein [Bdellovibrionales bacterium]
MRQVENPRRTEHLLVDDQSRLVAWLAAKSGLSREHIEDLMKLGALYVNETRARTNVAVDPGDVIRAHFEPKRFPRALTHKWVDVIVEQDSRYLVIDKPGGISLIPTVDNFVENVIFQLGRSLNKEIMVTHRLDEGTEGLVVVATDKEFCREFNVELRERRVTKIYECLTEKPVPVGLHTHFMIPSDRSPKVLRDPPQEGDQRCELVVESSLPQGAFWKNRIRLLTGRTHQIRVQLAALGAPIVDDTTYGGSQSSSQLGMGHKLRCIELGFNEFLTNRSRHFKLKRRW